MSTRLLDRQEMSGATAEAVPPALMTYEQAGAFLAVSPSTVRRLVNAGQLETVPVLGAVRIPLAELSGYVQRLRAQHQERVSA